MNTIEELHQQSERIFLTDEVPQFDEATRERLFQKALSCLPRWITANDPLPEIPDYLKPKKPNNPPAQ